MMHFGNGDKPNKAPFVANESKLHKQIDERYKITNCGRRMRWSYLYFDLLIIPNPKGFYSSSIKWLPVGYRRRLCMES